MTSDDVVGHGIRTCEELDKVIDPIKHDLLNDNVYQPLLRRASAGDFAMCVLGIPCSTFSVARIGAQGGQRGGPTPVRDRRHVRGLENHSG